MSYHEQIWLDECPLEFKPKFYRRYVDNIIILVILILDTKILIINFTSEFVCDGKLTFLDNLIDRKEGKFVTSMYESQLLPRYILTTKASYLVFIYSAIIYTFV